MKNYFGLTLLLCCGGAMGAGCCGGKCGGSSCCKQQCCKPAKQEKQSVKQGDQQVHDAVKQAYGTVAETGSSCCVLGGGCCGGGQDLSKYLGYSPEELAQIADANLGLGCGNPVSLGEIKAGQVIVDLGSGAGIDCLLAAKKVGPTGKVIGIDMTPAMIKKATENAQKYKIGNAEFRLGYIEELPVESLSVDIILSNCVINLSPRKDRVFQEAYRVLKPGGKMYVSDVVLLKDLTSAQKTDTKLLCACVSGAILKTSYIDLLKKTGFEVEVVGEDCTINKLWFNDESLPIASLKFIAYKK